MSQGVSYIVSSLEVVEAEPHSGQEQVSQLSEREGGPQGKKQHYERNQKFVIFLPLAGRHVCLGGGLVGSIFSIFFFGLVL